MLVNALLQQARALQIEFEILLFDDFSEQKIKDANQRLAEHEGIAYKEMPSNLGRSKIRNRLAEAAMGQYVLFLDNDGEIFSPDFLKDYWHARVDKGVVCGGTAYPMIAPSGCELHFNYGFHREAKNATIRNKAGHQGFKSNSFLVHNSVFEKIAFDESLQQYGHEDTLFGLELFKQQIPIKHIDNPILHNQLEENAEFLKKTRLGLQNLQKITQKCDQEALDFFPMLKLALKIKNIGLAPALLGLYKMVNKNLEKNLTSSKPSLRYFDLYRLGYLLSLLK